MTTKEVCEKMLAENLTEVIYPAEWFKDEDVTEFFEVDGANELAIELGISDFHFSSSEEDGYIKFNLSR